MLGFNKRATEGRIGRIKHRARAADPRAAVRRRAYRAARPTATVPASDEERRASVRAAIDGEVGVRPVGGLNFQAAIDNLSAGGCRVELLEAGAVGDRMITRLPRLEPLGSRICWTDGTTAGLEFANRIHPAVFEQLVDQLLSDFAAA